MNKKITVLIDLDDTMTHLCRAWCQWLNAAYGTNVSESDIKGWRVADYFPGLTEQQVHEPIHIDSFWASVEPVTGAAEYIKRLIEEGFAVYVCTASSFYTINAKLKFEIDRYFPFISREQIIVTTNKQLVRGDILIDDGIHNLEDGSYKKILMSAPHNEEYDAESHGMTRVNSWKEAYDAVHKYVSEIIGENSENESN